MWRIGAQVNDWLQVMANQAPSVHFLDCSLQFLVPGPTSEIEISSMLMKDFFHLTPKVCAWMCMCMCIRVCAARVLPRDPALPVRTPQNPHSPRDVACATPLCQGDMRGQAVPFGSTQAAPQALPNTSDDDFLG